MATKQLNIFVEGHDDHDLIVALLYELKGKAIRSHPTRLNSKKRRGTTYLELTPNGTTILVLATGGWTRLPEYVVQFREAKDTQGRNLIVFDADFAKPEYPQGGPVQRNAALRDLVAEFEPSPELFLFPGPSREGNIEILLLDLINPNHQQVMNCFNLYDECLAQYKNPATGQRLYYIPSDKRRVYDYVNVLPLSPDERKRHQEEGGQKIFENPLWWNLMADAIQPLRMFLDKYVQ
ncbi:hypothetical protein [Hymenobacter sp. PAMC 26628]|uniref:hypothetical protein n=1 Tax=Hymenobacter sp. PAMC 26628 TaxID=1484118 RepID=UPI000A875067|nr:hypothetical protein [Hymenobacter sp. PAMC 26628]